MADEDDLLVRIGLTEKQYLASLARLERQSTRAAKGAETAFKRQNRNFVRGAQQANRAASGFASGGLRQMSMQFSQVAQQGAVTGNYLQALAIQAPDLALGFGAIGIAAGALIPVLYGVAQGVFAADEAVQDINLQGAYDSATGALEAAREAQDRYTAAVRMTGAAHSLVTPEILENLRLEARAREALAALEMANLERQRLAAQQALADNRAQLAELVAQTPSASNLPADQTGGFARGWQESRALEATEDMLAANEDLVLQIRQQQAELDLVNALLAQNNGEASEMIDALLDAGTASGEAAAAIGGIDFSNALVGAQNLAQQLGISLHQAMQIRGLLGGGASEAGDAVFDPRSQHYDPEAARLARIRERMQNLPQGPAVPRVSSRSSSSGGGGGRSGRGGAASASTEAKEVEKWVERTRTAVESYNTELARLEELNRRGFFKEHPEAYSRAVAMVNEQFVQSEYGAVLDGINSVSDAMGNAIVNAEDMGEAVRGVLRQIAADLVSSGIREGLSGLFGLGSGGGLGAQIASAVFGGFRADGGPVSPGKAYVVGERGPELFTPRHAGAIVPNGAAGMSTVRIELGDGLVGNILQRAAGQTVQIVGATSRQQDRAFPARAQALQARGV
jgi:hypothetical protein